jgi:hypothetical protein
MTFLIPLGHQYENGCGSGPHQSEQIDYQMTAPRSLSECTERKAGAVFPARSRSSISHWRPTVRNTEMWWRRAAGYGNAGPELQAGRLGYRLVHQACRPDLRRQWRGASGLHHRSHHREQSVRELFVQVRINKV